MSGGRNNENRRWSPGRPLTAQQLNQVVDFSNDSRGVKERPRTERSVGGLALNQFVFIADMGDYITAYRTDTEGQTDEVVEIAKPYLLRRSPFDGLARDGITYTYSANDTRLADNTVTTETQVIVPKYVEGDLIYAAFAIIGDTDTTNGSNDAIEWLDMNADGRAWAKQA